MKLNNVNTLAETFTFIEEIRSQTIRAAHIEKASLIKSVACNIHDLLTVSGIDLFNPDDVDRIPLLTAMSRTMEDDKTLDNSVDAIGIARVNNTTLVLPFFVTKQAEELLLKHPKIIPFGYWDNSDREEGVSDAEWKRRKKIWGKLFKTTPIPSECMLIVNLIDTKRLIPDDQFMADLPSIEEREKTLATHLAFDSLPDDTQVHNLITLSSEKRKELLPTIQGKLRDITMETLSKSLPKVENTNE